MSHMETVEPSLSIRNQKVYKMAQGYPYEEEPTQKGFGQSYWIQYEAPHEYRGGTEHPRTYTKEVYISGRNPEFDTEPKLRENRQGNPTYGIKVTYENPVSGFQATRKATGTTYTTEEKVVEVTNVIPVPRDAQNVKVLKSEPD